MRVKDIVDLLWPEPCALCKTPVIHVGHSFDLYGELLYDGSYPICDACAIRLEPLPGPRCMTCGKELISEHITCMRCRNRDFNFARNASLFAYRDEVRNLIHAYKFKKRYALSRFFAANLYRLWKRVFAPAIIVPVPPRRNRFRPVRPRDQVERIALRMYREYGAPVSRYLRRAAGISQKTLDYDGRLSNLKGKFLLRKRDVALPAGDYVLLDDVFTTGATISECAGVLLAAGATRVFGLTIAID